MAHAIRDRGFPPKFLRLTAFRSQGFASARTNLFNENLSHRRYEPKSPQDRHDTCSRTAQVKMQRLYGFCLPGNGDRVFLYIFYRQKTVDYEAVFVSSWRFHFFRLFESPFC